MERLISSGYVKGTAELKGEDRIAFWRDIICDEFVRLDFDSAARELFSGELRGGVGFPEVSFAEVVSNQQVVKRSKSKIAAAPEEAFLISFQLESEGVVRQNGREALLTPGSFALYDSTQPYTLTFDKSFHQLVVQMPREVLSRHLFQPEKYTAIAINGRSGLGAVVTQFLLSLVREVQQIQQHPEGISDNLVNLIAMALSSTVMLDSGVQSNAAREALKRRVLHYVESNLGDPALTNDRIAQAQGISVRYLHKLFQSEAVSLHHLIRNKRLERARALLGNPEYVGHSIERIAYSMGFASAAHFSRAFRQTFGCSPSAYRANHC